MSQRYPEEAKNFRLLGHDPSAAWGGGSLVEVAPTDAILDEPRHPYTIGLIASIPHLDVEHGTLTPIPGRCRRCPTPR